MKLRRLGEDRLLAELLPSLGRHRRVITRAGDDCAVVQPPGGNRLVLLKCDCVVQNVHFKKNTDPVSVGWKAMMRPLSDFAAMSGVPQFALITLMLPPQTTLAWVKKVYRGMLRAAAKFDVAIVGGETSRAPAVAAISVSVSGYVEPNRRVLRSGGRAGDDLFVTGRLGGSIGGRHLRFLPRIDESRWLTKNFAIHALMDLSDGLGTDLPRLAEASGLGFELDKEQLPRSSGATIEEAVSDGEDYELLFAIAPKDRARLVARWRRKFPRLWLTRIGRLTPKAQKRKTGQLSRGYVHFK
jgi:thiamine-monophosphate kinase